MKKKSIFCLLVFLPLAAGADLQLKPIHPQETVEETLKQRFSLESALANVSAIKNCLDSFRRLTAAAKGKIAAAAWKQIGNTEWDVQTLGFANMPPAVEGALRYQNFQLKRALQQLAAAEWRSGNGSAQKVEQARRGLAQAEKEFQEFWNSMSIAD